MGARVGLLQACDDPELLGFELWPGQRRLLEEIERGPRIHCWALGRRSGKTTMAALTALWDCLLRPELDALVRPGETRYAIAVSTNISQARLTIQAAKSIAEASPLLAGFIAGSTEDEIRFELASGARTAIRAFPCSSRGGRGWPISTLILDEVAHFLSESDGFQTAERVFGALAPATAQFDAAGRVIMASTPYGTSGLFAELFGRADAGELEDAVAAKLATAQINPLITPAFLALEEKRDPDGYRAEFLAEFLGSGDSFIDFDRVELAGAPIAEPDDAVTWVAGLDPAFSRDPFGAALLGRTDEGKLVVGPVLALDAQGDFAAPVDEAARVLLEYRCQVAVTDQFCQAPVVERLRDEHGIHTRVEVMTPASKTRIYQELRLHLYDGSLRLPDHPGLINELRRLRTRFSAGSSAILNPRVGGSHGDMAQALAMAVGEIGGVQEAHAPVMSDTKQSMFGHFAGPGGGGDSSLWFNYGQGSGFR